MRQLLLCLCLVLAGCSSPYAKPERQPDRGFLGAADYLDPRFQPDPSRPRVRAILTHGMCSGDHRAEAAEGRPSWVALRAGQIAGALGGVAHLPEPLRPSAVYAPPGADPVSSAVQRYDVEIEAPEGTIEAVFLIWGRQVDRYRENLAYENTRRSPDHPDAPIRASLNATLKSELMNRCLIDAVVYLGENGNLIRRNMRAALCDALGGSFEAVGAGGDPHRPDFCRRPEADPTPSVLIPESLGSTILFEAFNGLDDGAGQARIAASLGSVRSIYLAANQVPLLSQATVPDLAPGPAALGRARAAAPEGALESFLALLSRRPALRALGPGAAPPEAQRVQLVAITDPNDVLGYRLDPEAFAGDAYPGIEMTNVLVSNAATWLGLLANPLAAHQDTARDQVFGLIARGSHGG
jgi:hypothetical protein